MGKLLDESGLSTLWTKIKDNFVKKTDLKDYIIERETDTNGWTYEKWNSGKLTAYKRKAYVFTSGQVTQAGNVYVAVITENLPSLAAKTNKYVYASHQGGYSASSTPSSVPRYSWCGECRALASTSGSDPINTTANTPLAVYVFGATSHDLTSSPGAAFDFYFTGSWN